MILAVFRRSSSKAVIERLYLTVVEGSRQTLLYTDLGIPDTFEGRFESLTLHAVLVLRRLGACPSPGPEMAQELVDTVFKHFDRMLREMGVGDTVVPKRMKKLAEAFLGRRAAYDEALREEQHALRLALERNIYNGGRDATRILGYVEASVAGLAMLPLQAFIEGNVTFADLAGYASEVEP